MGMFHTLRHLLPDARAWRLREDSFVWKIGDGHKIGDDGLYIGGRSGGAWLSRFFLGLGGFLDPVRAHFDGIYSDLDPATTTKLAEWSEQFGEQDGGTTAEQRASLTAAWLATGGQSPSYIQSVLRAAGFDVYIHDWWSSGPPYVARDPRDYTDEPLIGTVQCSDLSTQPQCSNLGSQPQCNAFLANDTHYIVNKDLTRRAPPPVPDEPAAWPHFIYVGGETFPAHAEIPIARRAAFERRLLRLRPLHKWIVTLIDYV